MSLSLGQRIKQARKDADLTLVELGDCIGVSHAALSQIENDKVEPTRQTLVALARELRSDFGDESLTRYAQRASDRERIASMFDELPEQSRPKALEIMEALWRGEVVRGNVTKKEGVESNKKGTRGKRRA